MFLWEDYSRCTTRRICTCNTWARYFTLDGELLPRRTHRSSMFVVCPLLLLLTVLQSWWNRLVSTSPLSSNSDDPSTIREATKQIRVHYHHLREKHGVRKRPLVRFDQISSLCAHWTRSYSNSQLGTPFYYPFANPSFVWMTKRKRTNNSGKNIVKTGKENYCWSTWVYAHLTQFTWGGISMVSLSIQRRNESEELKKIIIRFDNFICLFFFSGR